MKNTQFTPLTQQEMMTVNGGGLLDGIVGLVNGLPIVGGLLGGLLNTVQGLVSSLLGQLPL